MDYQPTRGPGRSGGKDNHARTGSNPATRGSLGSTGRSPQVIQILCVKPGGDFDCIGRHDPLAAGFSWNRAWDNPTSTTSWTRWKRTSRVTRPIPVPTSKARNLVRLSGGGTVGSSGNNSRRSRRYPKASIRGRDSRDKDLGNWTYTSPESTLGSSEWEVHTKSILGEDAHVEHHRN